MPCKIKSAKLRFYQPLENETSGTRPSGQKRSPRGQPGASGRRAGECFPHHLRGIATCIVGDHTKHATRTRLLSPDSLKIALRCGSHVRDLPSRLSYSHLFQPQETHLWHPSWNITGVLHSGHFRAGWWPLPLGTRTCGVKASWTASPSGS